MKDGIQTYEFKFKFNAKDSKKQLKSISDDVLQMIHNMDTASNKMKVFTNFVGYLEKLDVALDQFKADHKDDFKNMFGDVDSQLTKSLESALGLSQKQLGQLGELRSRIDGAFANKANTEELRKIAQDINALFDAIGRPAELDIDGLFSGKGNLNERIGALNNALYKFYLQYQLITNSIQNGFASGGMQGFSGLSEEVQKEVKRLSDAYDELITVQQKLQKAQSDIDKIHTKNNKKVVEQYKIELNEESVSQLMTEFDLLNAQLESGDSSSKEYYENLLKMTDVILKLNSALKTIRDDKSLLTAFQGISVGGGYSHMFDKLSKYTTQKATQFENNFLGKTLTDGIAELMLSSRTQIEKLILGNTGRLIGGSGSGNGSGSGDGDGEKQISLYKQLVSSLKEYTKAYAEYKALEDAGADEDELESKGDYIDELKEKIYQLVNLSEEASDAASDIFNVYENGKYNFNQLVDELTKVLGIAKEINEEGSGKKLKTYEELLKIFDKLNALGLDETDFADSNVQKLVKDLKDLYAAEEQLEDVDNILHGLIDGEIDDITALNKLTTLFGIEIPDGVKIAAQKIDDFYDKIKSQHALGLESEFSAGEYKSEMELLKNELQELREQGRITESQFDDIEKAFDRDVKGYVNTFIGRNNVLNELNKLNKDASLTDEESALEAIVQKRREILAAAEQNGTLLSEQLSEEKAITDEIEKRIGLKKQDGQGNGQGSGSGGSGTGNGSGSGTGSGDAADENEQYQKLLETINLVTQAVNDKTAAFVTEKNTVDDVVEQEIEALERLSDYLDTIKTTAQSVFGEKQGVVNSSVKEWQQALESIHNTMQAISNMQSVEEMLSRMAANALDMKNNLNVSGDSGNIGSGSSRTETITNVDFTSLEGTLKSEIASLIGKLDNVLKVEVVKSDAEEIKSAVGGVQKSIDSIVTTINAYKANNANGQQQDQIDAMKNNLLQLQQFVSNFNSRIVDGKYQQQEITGAILSDGSISVGYGEKGEVPWDRVASSLVANLTKSLVVDLHSHPLKQLTNGQMYANDSFSGPSGDLSAFSFSKELGAKLAAEITGNVMRVLDLSKLSETQMMSLSDRLRHIERDYAKRPEYSKYIVHEDGKIKYNQQSTLQGQHKVTEILESMMYEAFKGMGYSKEKVDKELFKKYDLTDDKQLTELASRLIQLSSASQTAIEPLERLKNIVSLFGGNLGSSEAKTAFEAFTKGELSAADVFNQLNGKGYKINQNTVDSLFRIDSANEIPAVESLLTQVTSILNTISSSISSIDGKINTSTGDKFDYALNDLMEFSGLNDVGSEITKRITSTIESKFDPSNVSEYKVQELSLNALNKAQDLIKNFEYVESKNGQISVERTQVMLDNFVSTLRAMEDAMNQEELYRERTGKKVLNDQGKNLEDDLVTTFYATFSKENIQSMRNLLARGKEKWQAKKYSYGDGVSEKFDPIDQNVDSLTSAIGELQTIVNGLQQYIASPQFTIKADTSTLEESLSNVSTEINAGAQRITDAVNEFGSKVNIPVEQGQLSIDRHEMTMAMKEALYAKEFSSNYEKAQWGDIFESHWDWGLDQSEYINKLTGEVFSTFEEADEHFDKYFSNFYKSLDESFIGTKEAAFDDLIKNLPDNNDFATVIVQAIQDQTGKIVNAIKVVLPESISSSASTNGAIDNEDQIKSAFQYIAKRASKWSDMTDRDPRDFFNSILRRNGNVQMDRGLEDALHTLGMLSPSGKPTFKVAQECLRNLGVAIAEDFALPSRPIELNQVSELMPLLDEAAKLGASIPRIVSSFTDVDRVFELQTKMKGSNIASSFDWLSATTEQIDGFIHTLEVLNKVGLYPDFIGDNVLFDQNKGFSLVDIETQPLKFGLDSAEDMGRWFVKYLTHMDWDGRDYEFQNFIDLFSERLALPSDQRLVNENTIAQQRNAAVINETVNVSGLDEAIGKIVQAANAIEAFVSNFGNAVSTLMNQIPNEQNEYQDIQIYDSDAEPDIFDFKNLYDAEDVDVQSAINDLALFTREYDALVQKMNREPLQILDTLNPTAEEKAQVLDIFDQIKQKNLEIMNTDLATEEDINRVRQLKAEIIGLQNELRGAATSDGFVDDYRDIYGLDSLNANIMANLIDGPGIHSDLHSQLAGQLQTKLIRVDSAGVASDTLSDEMIRFTQGFKQFLLEHAKRLLGEKSVFDPASVGYEHSDSSNINEESTALQGLASEISTVEQAVRNKTAAFEAEGVTVNQVVEGEIAVLKELSDVLNTVQTALQTIFSGNVYNFGNLDLLPDNINDHVGTSVFQEIQQTLGQILTVLQGFTGLESDGENSLKHKEPVVDNGTGAFDISDTLASKLNEIATEGTLIAIKDAVNQLADVIKVKDGSEPDNNNDINSTLHTLINSLSANITSLKEVMDGIVVHQKAQKSDTTKAMARIQDPKQNQIISGLAKSAVDSLGDEAEVESLQALANGLVKVEGAFKNAEGQWEGFTVKINEHNEAVDLAVKKHSSFARLLNKGMPIEDDNPFVFGKDEVEKRAQKHLEEYAAQGKNATVQFKDSGRYTITILEEIDGLSKQIFQTFDENDDKIERTTVTMSNSQKMKLDNLQKKLIENGLANDLINDKDSVYNDYQNASDALNNMTVAYSKLDDISDVQIDQWKQQITLVQQLGAQVEALIKQRKLANDQKVFESDRSKKLSKFDLDKASLYSNIDMSKVSQDLVDDIAVKRSAIENATDADSLKIAINNWEALQNQIKATAVQHDLYIKKTKESKQEPDQFTKDLTKQKTDFAKYKTDAENAIGVSQELKDKLNDLEARMSTIGSVSDLADWIQDFKNLKTEISNAQKSFKVSQKAKASDIAGQANAKFNKDLNFKVTDSNLTAEQEKIKNKRAELLQQIAEYNIKVESGQEAEISGIEATRDALYELINAYKKKYNIVSSDSGTKKGQAYGLNQLQTFTARYNSLITDASNVGFDNNVPVVANLISAYGKLKTAQSAFVAGEDKTTDVYAKKVEVFKAAQFECNKYARELSKVVTSSKKLESDSVLSDSLSEDFEDDTNGRKVALKDFVNSMYGARATIGDFDAKCNELNFTIKNSDGTFTQMTATINQARTAIHATAGATKEMSSGFKAFFSGVLSKFKSIIPYLTASFGWQEIWQQVRQGITYVREIDKALTELKKVTNETDAVYDNFLQDMSKTARVVGSTVSSLTDSAASWARLGHSIEEAGLLAKNTAILMNVSEFENISDASDAMISALKAFSYSAEDSLHLVDIFNSIGNNFAISTSDLASSLTKSASALVTAGVGIEQASALLTGANTIMQDPDSVSQGLKIISLRIRGVKSELQELGEDTDNILNTPKLQEKIKALTGVDIIDSTGGFRNIYDILMDIADVWNELDSMSQASVIELMAGKNRSNVFTSLMSQADTIKEAYAVAMDSEGSAMRENERYLESIQGHIDTFNNSLQTMWMNFLNTDAIKWFIHLGDTIIKLVDDVGVLNAALTVLAMRMSAKYFKVDFAQWFNVKNLKHPVKSVKDWFKTIENGSTIAQDNLDALTKSYEDAKNAYELNPFDQKNLNAYNTAKLNLETYQQTASEAIEASNNLKEAQEHLANAQNRLNNYTGNSKKELYKLQDGLKRAQKGVEDATEANKKFEQSGSQSFANVGKKVENFTKQVQSAVASMLVMYAITKIINLIGDAFDKMNESSEEAKQSFDDLTSELSDTKSSLRDLKSELSNIENQITEINQKSPLSFTDEEELNRLKSESEELKRQIEYTELLQKQQQLGVNQSAVNAAEKYKQTGTKTDKTASENIGTKAGDGALIGAGIGTVAVGSAAASIGSAALGAKAGTAIGTAIAPAIGTLIGAVVGAIGGAAVGVIVGGIESATDETIGETMDNMTDNYNRLQSKMQTAREKYMQSGKKKDQEKYEESLEAFNKYQSEMATYMTEMDTIYSQMDWETATEEERKAMQEFYNQRDKWALTSEASGAKTTALDRIFGENASEEIQAIEDQITEAVKNGQEFDFEKAVESSQELKDTLEYIGLDTEDVKDYFTQIGEEAKKAQEATSILSDLAKTLDSIQSKYDTLQGAIDEFNERGAISGETLKSLIDNNLLQYLTFTENGLIADANAMQMLEQAAINEAYAMLNAAMVQDMENYALGKTEQLSALAQNAIGLAGSAAANAGAQAAQGAQGFLSFASAVAQAGIIDPGNLTAGLQQIYNAYQNIGNAIGHTSAYRPSDAYKSAAGIGGGGSGSNSAKEIDWIEHYYTEIENRIDELNARLENKISNVQALDAKNTIIDKIIDLYDQKQQKLANAVATYDARADYLFSTFSSDIQNKINNGSLDISSITDEGLASNIEEYYDYIDAASQARVEAEELKQTITDLAKQKFDNISTAYENEIGLVDAYIDALQDQIDATEARGEQVGASYYESMIDSAENRKQSLEEERNALQASLDEAVKLGQVEVGSDTWYEMVNAIYELDGAIVEAEISMEEWQTAINDLHWENFDKLISKLDGIASELDNIYERLTDNDEAFDENGNWTNQGIAALGMLTQKMEQAQFAAQQYAEQIDKLNTDYAAGKYSEEEYNEKLAELTEGQWESIEAYEAAKDEIIDLNKARVDAVKDGMQKELDAYKELIDAKKEALEADKEAHDWAKQIAEKEQNIADIQRKLAALSSDNSTSATAQKKKLQAELLKAQSELNEAYYDKSIEDQQDALDKEYESYEENQQKEIDSLEEWLDDRETVIQDSFDLVKENTQVIYDELLNLSQEYGVQISDEIIAPWQAGKDAIGEYKDAFTNPELNVATSEFISQLDSMKSKWEETASAAEDAAQRQIDAINAQKEATIAAQNEIQANTPTATDVGSMGNVGYDDSDSGSSGGSAGWGSGIGKTTPVEEIEIPELEEEIIEPEIQEELDEIQSIFDKIKEKAPEVAEKLMQEFSKFFNETLPNAWNAFWEKVGAKFTELGVEAEKLGSIIGIFFTETVPEKWNEFWNKVGIKFEELGADAQKLGEAASIFFTQTIPEKWNAFWTEVGQILTQDIPYAIGYATGVVYGFFSVTLPEAWAEFWDSVDTFLNDTLPAAYEELKNKLNAFWNEVIVSGWHEFWDNVDIFLHETLPSYLEELKNELNTFWNETIVANWHEFWDNVSIFLHETLPTMAEEILNSINTFWNETIVGGWYDFWDSVDVFINETIPNALAELDNRIRTFWNETVVEGWHEFWDNVDMAFFTPIQTAFVNICNDISAFFSGIPGYISGMWNDVTGWISEQASAVWENLTSGFTAGFNFITGGSSANGTANANGTAYKGGTWGAPKTETSLVGELGPEILVRNGKWTTVGENGAEFTQVKKGDIIFNHKQAEQLLKHGHITGRGKAYASGTWKNASNNLDDLGEELTMCIGPSGSLQFLPKVASTMATGTIDSLMNLTQLDPTDILNRSRPSIGVHPSVVNNTMEFKIDASVGELIHVDHLDGNNLDEIGKFVDKAWEKKMQTLNNSIKKFTR